ncbi:hypothetical protein HETIRDRAFT_418842 [Heterobasidion irregulare TC 32-1]|uniref:Uncharacterized protein n=1 Tax=Heterobasidion irregulare (strain TC 32-1) TaxID=747525 RepID=W4K585_HETIT|nr:uncharacterized protein HETIRDRAFT_418842 [Heterobasidion irregulare TC 32-1]ETW80904.1 hypothetical protein HETIRDRAFT_418842 [Heterobasidion irregulare TC 32-1]
MSPASIPALLWRWYVDALWNYSPDSWVASAAYTFRLLALIVILPGVLLTLLDVTSYVIARTLGDTSAYTSDKTPAPASAPAPAPTPTTPATSSASPATPHPARSTAAAEAESPPAIVVQPGSPHAARFPAFAGAEERLAGVGVFSPAASQPGSPVLGRRQLVRGEENRERAEDGDGDTSGDANENGDGDGDGDADGAADGGASGLRREGAGSESWQNMWGEASTNGSTSGSESFAILERDESFEDAGAVQMRRRVPRGGAGNTADGS